MGNPGQDNEAGTRRPDNKVRSDNKKSAELVAKTFRNEAQRLLCYAFFLAVCSNFSLSFHLQSLR